MQREAQVEQEYNPSCSSVRQYQQLPYYYCLLFFLISVATTLLPFRHANAVSFTISPNTDVVGKVFTIKAKQGDTLINIGKKYSIGRHEMLSANRHTKTYKLKIGQKVTVPQLFILPPREYRQGIVINIPELRLYYFSPDTHRVMTFPVALGRTGWRTPTMATTVQRKKTNPTWYVPESIKNYTYEKSGRLLPDFIPSGPQNPLGYHALYLGRRGYLIHGTNNPSSIGTLASSGCIRMYNKDIETLFHVVAPGKPVTVIHHIYKAGWKNNNLFLEVHKAVSHNEHKSILNYTLPEDVIAHATVMHRRFSINWDKVNQVLKQQTGIPVLIGKHHD